MLMCSQQLSSQTFLATVQSAEKEEVNNFIFSVCEKCPPINATNCTRLQQRYQGRSITTGKAHLLEPRKEQCFSPNIVYYGGLGCLMARFSCYYANLYIDGVHSKTRLRLIEHSLKISRTLKLC